MSSLKPSGHFPTPNQLLLTMRQFKYFRKRRDKDTGEEYTVEIDIGPACVVVYNFFSAHADRTNKTGEAYPSAATIAKYSGLSSRTIQRAIKALTEANWLVPRKNRKSKVKSKTYWVRGAVPPEKTDKLLRSTTSPVHTSDAPTTSPVHKSTTSHAHTINNHLEQKPSSESSEYSGQGGTTDETIFSPPSQEEKLTPETPELSPEWIGYLSSLYPSGTMPEKDRRRWSALLNQCPYETVSEALRRVEGEVQRGKVIQSPYLYAARTIENLVREEQLKAARELNQKLRQAKNTTDWTGRCDLLLERWKPYGVEAVDPAFQNGTVWLTDGRVYANAFADTPMRIDCVISETARRVEVVEVDDRVGDWT